MRLSIIIPYYNRLPQITKLIEVLESQLTEQVEILIIDDGSHEKELDKFKARVIHLEENSGGASIPRNVGLDNAKGEYIAFIDSDDIVKPNYISKILDKTKEEWDYCYISWETEFQKVIIENEPPNWNCCVWNCIYKKELIGSHRFRADLKIAEDYYFNLEVRKGKKANITEILYCYTENSAGSLYKQGETYNNKYRSDKNDI